jgi:hypothetical protein
MGSLTQRYRFATPNRQAVMSLGEGVECAMELGALRKVFAVCAVLALYGPLLGCEVFAKRQTAGDGIPERRNALDDAVTSR